MLLDPGSGLKKKSESGINIPHEQHWLRQFRMDRILIVQYKYLKHVQKLMDSNCVLMEVSVKTVVYKSIFNLKCLVRIGENTVLETFGSGKQILKKIPVL